MSVGGVGIDVENPNSEILHLTQRLLEIGTGNVEAREVSLYHAAIDLDAVLRGSAGLTEIGQRLCGRRLGRFPDLVACPKQALMRVDVGYFMLPDRLMLLKRQAVCASSMKINKILYYFEIRNRMTK